MKQRITNAERLALRIKGLKKCNKCFEIKTFDEFGINRYNADKLMPYCKICLRIQSKENYQRKLKEVEELPLVDKNSISKKCSQCHKIKSGVEFYRSKIRKCGLSPYCIECKKNNYFPKPESRRKYRARIKQEVLDVYGRECACCGEDYEPFLTIDHINGDGAQQRKQFGKRYRGMKGLGILLKKLKFPPGYQILCMNCNLNKGSDKRFCDCPYSKDKR